MSSDGHETWRITFEDGSTETTYGRLAVADGVLQITERGPYGGYVKVQVAYPLTALRKWELVQ